MVAAKIPQDKIAEFCKRRHIKLLSLFGSVLTDAFDNSSDIDVLVEFEEGYTPGLSFFSMQEELSTILGRKADLCTPKFLSRYIRDRVQATAEVQYASS
jgi:predicted nucleotidyltransferase